MSQRGEQVQKLLASLTKHADLVAQAFEGPVSGGDRARNAAIETLFKLSVLKPYDEDVYRLNPRLREFISDHFSSYQAFQALRRVAGTRSQALEQWNELRRLKSAGSARDQARMANALDESIVEIAYAIEHNLSMLHSLISTQYGNVDDLNSKLRQNRYYARHVDTFLRDVESIDAFVETVAEEAIASGLLQVRSAVLRRLGARRLDWTSQIKDAQGAISKRLFEAKMMEQRLRRLSRFSLWLARNKTLDGWDIDVQESIRPEVGGAQALRFRPQPDVTDPDPVTMEGMLAAVARLPAKAVPAAAASDPGPQLLVEDEETVEFQMSVQHSALEELVRAAQAAPQPISLLAFKRAHSALTATSDAVWMVFACAQLRSRRFRLDFVHAVEADPFPINERFHDVNVLATSHVRKARPGGTYAAELVRMRTEPVLAFVDFDPAGLMMAKSIPADRFLGFVLPDRDWLRTASDNPRGRQLYSSQVPVFGRTLDAAQEPLIQEQWEFMKTLARAV